jgi:N6-L-threonylcarbamoyladenine synthase
MKILAVESSCDETSAAVLNIEGSKIKLLSNVIATSLPMHSKTGGIIPENAAREQLRFIIPVIKNALEKAQVSEMEVDKIAVTVGPGLIGSLLVGVETVKTYAYVLSKPVIPVNHLYGHIYANFINQDEIIEFPAIALVVSGGHTDIVLMKNKTSLEWLGGTRDDAAGEALDKTGRLLGLPYPAGPKIEELATQGKDSFKFPRPLIDSKDYDFSFSGLKTAVLREVQKIQLLDSETVNNLCNSIQSAIIEVIIAKTLRAAKEHNARSVLLGGGVAANGKLREQFEKSIVDKQLNARLFVPPKNLCTDNAAMIGAAAALIEKGKDWRKIVANPELYFD